MDEAPSRPIRPGAYAILFLLFVSVLLLTHLPWIDLPYFWDEAGYYIPAALDLLHSGSPIPHSVAPLIHPPALSAWLAAVWSIAGFHSETTRCAMLLACAAGALASLLLAIELLREAHGMPAFLAAGMLCLSPVFFAQAMMAQPDAPAMLFTALALWLFLRNRIELSAAASIALVLTKETGIVAPFVFGVWLLWERRWRDAIWFLAPAAALGIWIAALRHVTGSWAGDPHFVDYNFFYSIEPARVAFTALHRLYYLFFANLHWVGTFAIAFAWRTSRIFRSRAWRVSFVFAAAHVATVTILGGAALERYVLPVLPILYAAFAAGLSLFPRRPRVICSTVLLAGLTVGIFVNPPYPFPYEDNLACADFIHLHREAADFTQHWYSGARVLTIWPLTIELARPALGYVNARIAVDSLPDLSEAALRGVDWSKVGVFAAYSRTWDPPLSPLRWAPIRSAWTRLFGYKPTATEEDIRRLVPFPAAAHWEHDGQWMDIYVNPRQPLTPPGKSLRAGIAFSNQRSAISTTR
jgi:4-amino-4-deoxy-L-arabinose transferase-like glycosyltransferase